MEEKLVITAERSTYKGFPILTLSSGKNEKYPFSFGPQKARRIVSCMKEIQDFVAYCDELDKQNAAEAARKVLK